MTTDFTDIRNMSGTFREWIDMMYSVYMKNNLHPEEIIWIDSGSNDSVLRIKKRKKT